MRELPLRWVLPVAAVTAAAGVASPLLAFGQEEDEYGYGQEQADGDVDTGENVYEYLDDALVAAALEDVLSRPEFERLRARPEAPKEPAESELPQWLQDLADRLGSWLTPDGEGEEETGESGSFWLPDSGLMNLVVYGLAAVALAIFIAFIVKAIGTSSRSRRIKAPEGADDAIFRSDRAPGEISPAEYWRRAIAHGESGDYRQALREILLAAMSTIERRGLIRFRRGLTNRDYFFAVRGAPRESFAVIAQAFELVYFGRREATAEAYRDCHQAFEKSFHVEQPT